MHLLTELFCFRKMRPRNEVSCFRTVSRRKIRGIAQSGSAPGLGPGCREFESLYPDQFSVDANFNPALVAQLDRASAF